MVGVSPLDGDIGAYATTPLANERRAFRQIHAMGKEIEKSEPSSDVYGIT